MAFKFHMIGGAPPLENNQYFDATQIVRIGMGASVVNEVSGQGYPENDDIHLRILEVEPSDISLPVETLTFWMNTVGMGVNRQLKVKYKDAGGTVRSASLVIMI